MMASTAGAIVPNTGGIDRGRNSNATSSDPYLNDDFHPLSLASSEILSALRADESASDADLYRRLISSSGAGAHRYHVAQGEEGCGEVNGGSTSGGGSSSPSGGAAANNRGNVGRGGQSSSSSPSNVIGSPLGVLRGSRRSSTDSNNNNSNNNNNNNGSPQSNSGAGKSVASSPPTSYLKHEKSLPLPAHLAAEANKPGIASSMMGLLPEANLVWLSADHKLFLWSYNGNNGSTSSGGVNNNNTTAGNNDGASWGSALPHHNNQTNQQQDYCSFTVQSRQIIMSVGLVRAKPGVFTENVKWCLVITTPEEAILCALASEKLANEYEGANGDDGFEHSTGGFRHGSDSILRLIPTRFVLPTDSVPLISVCGSKEGRIFLGGYDGCLYEMSYEGNYPKGTGAAITPFGHSGSEVMEAAIDDYFDGNGIFSLDGTSLNPKRSNLSLGGALLGGKRVFSALTFGSLDDTSSYGGGTPSRSRKCRKINHSSAPGSLISRAVPGALVRVASGIFGSSKEAAAKKGGPVVSVVMDEERLCLYTLGAKGVICTYDVSPLPSAGNSTNSSGPSPAMAAILAPPRLASVMDAPTTAKLYLDSVSRGRMYPPSTSQSIALGTITFPGGNPSAQAGVGGMDGARDILKRHDLEGRMLQTAAAASGGGSNSSGGLGMFASSSRSAPNELNDNKAGILHPVSIHLVPTSQSKSLTLVAITGGGLRYYLSSLSSSNINSSLAMGGGYDYNMRRGSRGSSEMMDPRLLKTRPSNKMMFCHVRAPPPYTSPGGNDGLRFELAPSAVNFFSGGAGGNSGIPPGIHSAGGRGRSAGGSATAAAGDVVKGCYGNGVFVLALDVEKGKSGGNPSTSSSSNFFRTPSDDRSSSNSSTSALGDAIVVALPDCAARVPSQPASAGMATGLSSSTPVQNVAPGGLSEAILMPMSGLSGTTSPVLPGGRTFDIVTSNSGKSSLVSLFINSETPSDVELQLGLMSSFTPKKKWVKRLADQSTTESRALVESNDRGRGVISSALSALSFYLRSGQGFGYEVGTVSQDSNGFGPSVTYRISARHGCDSVGFSNSAGESVVSAASRMRQRSNSPGGAISLSAGSTAKSARLPLWLLRPSAAPLNSQASQHLVPPGSSAFGGSSGSDVLILNSGGLHLFMNSSLLNNLATVLLRANSVAKDTLVKNFFMSYGQVEGCAMCFALATSSSSSDALRRKAEQAALCYTHRPIMKLTGPSAGDGMDPLTSYTFQPSSLYEGLVKYASRLLRPFWYKPAVVVTEGRPIQSRSAYANYYAALPAKVELLLDDTTSDELRRPLVILRDLMEKNFPAVRNVPGVKGKSGNDAMDVDEDGNSLTAGGLGNGGTLITRAMQNHSRAIAAEQRMNNNSNQQYATGQELQEHAFNAENRNMHSLYRLITRSIHLLNLISCLKGAHSTPALPEVQWGLLHGLTFYQLITSPDGQARVETLLNALVSGGETTLANGLSTAGDLLADKLSRECYLFYSTASQLTYEGFSSANAALSIPMTNPRRVTLINQAASYMRSAARHWYAPALVAGRLMKRDINVTWEDVVTNAMESGSPLALAADILMKLGHTEGLADVCLICASNFGGARVPRDERKEHEENVDKQDQRHILNWEKGLYHRPPMNSNNTELAGNGGLDSRASPTGTRTIVTGLDVTASDALRTCHSIIFHYVSKLLKEAVLSNENQLLADKLVATCAASSDVNFLHSLYEHLLAINQAMALRIDSTSLEHWLLEVKKDVGLLWEYYSLHERHVLAGEIMHKRALKESPEEKIRLDHRIECLTRAANSFDCALKANNSGAHLRHLARGEGGVVGSASHRTSESFLQEQKMTPDILKSRIVQIQEQLDVASIQKRILTTINQSVGDTNLDTAKLDALSYSFVNVSDLYNEYTCPLNLFDECLLILETCRSNNSDNIHLLWKSIICEEVLPCSTNNQEVLEFLGRLKRGSLLEEETVVFGEGDGTVQHFENGEWILRLKNRVTALGKELYGKGADYTFPLDLVVRELEGLREICDKTHQDDTICSQPWPAQTVLDVGVPFYTLVESYDSLLMDENNSGVGGVDIATRLQQLASMSELLEMWVSAALSSYGSSPMRGSNGLYASGQGSSSSQLTRAISTGGLLQRIEAYKSALTGMVEVSAGAVTLVAERLENVEETIRKNYL